MKPHRQIEQPPLISTGSIVVVMILIAGWVFYKAIPSSEAARLRNALLAKVGNQTDFNWLPKKMPSSYKKENISKTNELSTNVSKQLGKISGTTELEKSLVIAKLMLSNDDPKGGAIMSNTSEALQLIVEKGTGYCADYTQVFNGAAYLHDIPVREWGLSFDRFGGDGHALNEIFDDKLHKWVLLDTFYGFYLVDDETQIPLSVIEFQHFLQTEALEDIEKKVKIVKIKPDRFGFLSANKLFQYFSRGKDHFYLWWGNDTLSYDNNLIVSSASKFSRYVEQMVAIALGVQQEIRLLPNKANIPDISNLFELRTKLVTVCVLETALGLVLICIYLRKLVKYRKNHRK